MSKWKRVTAMSTSVLMVVMSLVSTITIANAEEIEEPAEPIIFVCSMEMIEETPQAELLENPTLTSEIVFGVDTENIEKMTPGVIIETPYKVYEEEEVVKVNPPMESHLTKSAGVFYGPSGKETYYNLNMSRVVAYMRDLGYSESEYPYWVRDDGVKMLGPYVMVAANLSLRPKGTILETSLGTAIVVDTGSFAKYSLTDLDVACAW